MIAAPKVVIGVDPAGKGSGATVAAVIQAGTITSINIISPGSGYTTVPTVRFANVLPSFGEQVKAILADFGDQPDWVKVLDTFRAMAKFGDSAWIEVAGHCHGLLYRADGVDVREQACWDLSPPEPDWIIWRAHENRFYKGDRGALLAGAGIPLDGEESE